MLDPTEQAKGGFGAQIARAEEQHVRGASDHASRPAPGDAAAESQADGEPGPAPRPPLKPALPAPPARPPKRWR